MIIVQVRNILSNLSKGIVFSLANSKNGENCLLCDCIELDSKCISYIYRLSDYATIQLESRFVETGLIKGLAIILQGFTGLFYYVVW